MRVSTANRVLLWIVVGIGAFGLLLVLAGDREGVDMLRIFVALALTFVGLWWLGYHYRVLPRRESFAGQARDVGLRAERGDPLGLLGSGFALFHWAASAREIENTARGRRGGLELAVVDYWLAPTSASERDDFERYTCVITPAPAGWPELSVVPERIASRLRSRLALPDIETESEEFNRRFEVRSTDSPFASALLDPRMMQWLLEQVAGVGFEGLGGRLMLFRPRATTSVDDLARAIELHDRFLEQIPHVVRDRQL